MRIAVISDIHSNVFASEAVLFDVKKHGADLILNLGDILYGPIAPKETYDLLMLHDIETIRGNQDRQIYEATSFEIQSNPTMKFIVEDLGTEPIDWMKSLPFDRHLSDDIYLCHGSPTSDLDYLLENVESGRAVLRNDEEILRLLNGESSKIILCGHTHLSRNVKLSSGQLVVNPGSVGLPAYKDDEPYLHVMENYSPHASYSMLEKSNSDWIVNHIKVPYQYELAASEAKKRKRDDWEYYLTTGRAHH